MSSSSASRGQVEPTAALVAVVAVCLSVSLYAGVLDDALPSPDRDLARPTLDRLLDTAGENGIVVPAKLDEAQYRGPTGYSLNVSLTTPDRRWTLGATPPRQADTTRELVSVRLAPGRIVPGTLRVEVWR